MLVAGIQAAAIGLIDDLVFAGIDVGGSYKSPGEVAVDLGKKVVTAAASIGINAAFNGVGKFVEKTDITGKVVRVAESGNISKLVAGSLGDGFGQVFLDSALAGVQTLATSTASTAVNAVTYSAKDGFGYSYEAFADGAKSGLASAAAALTSTFTAGALGQLNLGKGGVKAAGLNPTQIEDIQKFNKTVGGLAGQGVNYALGEDFTVNLLNLSMLNIDIKGERLESGLFELKFGHDGVSAAISTGGVDMSIGMIGSALLGGLNWGVSAWSDAAARHNGVKDTATTLRSQWGYGDGQGLAKDIKNLIAEGIIAADLIAEPEPQADGDISAPEPEQSFWQSAAATEGGLLDNLAGNLFKRQENVPEAVMEESQISDYIVSMEQWSKLADPEFYGKYEAQVKTKTSDPLKQLNGLSTQCNTFVDAVIKGFGDKVYNDIMPYGSQSPNELYKTWNANKNLIQLKNEDDAWVKAQEYADQGYIVLSAASENGNHVAFVMPKGYEYNSLPSTDWKQREGVNPSSGTIDYSPEKMKSTWPAFLQSGSYTGILSPGWAYSPDMVRDKEVHFYVYKRGEK